MSVVLRCPNCGTTQGRVGECEACSEGDVRYFCANHDEGIWLDGPVCSRCGAKFGDIGRRPAPMPPPVPTPPAGAPDFRAPARSRRPARRPEPHLGGPPPRRPDPGGSDPEVVPRTPSLADWLEEIAEARTRMPVPAEVDETPWVGPPRRGIGFPLAGCLARILGLGLLLVLAFVIFLVLLFGGFIVG